MISIIRLLLVILTQRLPTKRDPFTYQTQIQNFFLCVKVYNFNHSPPTYYTQQALNYKTGPIYILKTVREFFPLCEMVYDFNPSSSTYYTRLAFTEKTGPIYILNTDMEFFFLGVKKPMIPIIRPLLIILSKRLPTKRDSFTY